MLKTEKDNENDSEEQLLESLLIPVVRDEQVGYIPKVNVGSTFLLRVFIMKIQVLMECSCKCVALLQTALTEGQASSSADKPDEDDNTEPLVNPVVLEKVKPDERSAPASEPMVPNSAIPPESEVATPTVKDDPPASEAPDDSLPSHQSKTNAPVNPLGSYGKQTFSGNPLGSYGKEPAISGNPLGSYGKNPLGMYK